jgi:hypothetical protein
MDCLRPFIARALAIALAASVARAQSSAADDALAAVRTPRLQIDFQSLGRLQRQPPTSAALQPAAKGALIGAAIGAGAWGGIGLWYCTIGPHEVGECGVEQWVPGFLVWGSIGAGIGALIGAMR